MTVSIRALEWTHYPPSPGRNEEWIGLGACHHLVRLTPNEVTLGAWDSAGRLFFNLDAAKSAAQQDYTNRILSAIEPTPSYAEGRAAGLREGEAERDKLREALLPFAQFAVNTDENGWLSNIHREAISTWFGPTAFRDADAAIHPTDNDHGDGR